MKLAWQRFQIWFGSWFVSDWFGSDLEVLVVGFEVGFEVCVEVCFEVGA